MKPQQTQPSYQLEGFRPSRPVLVLHAKLPLDPVGCDGTHRISYTLHDVAECSQQCPRRRQLEFGLPPRPGGIHTPIPSRSESVLASSSSTMTLTQHQPILFTSPYNSAPSRPSRLFYTRSRSLMITVALFMMISTWYGSKSSRMLVPSSASY